jgi:hypothetical protein
MQPLGVKPAECPTVKAGRQGALHTHQRAASTRGNHLWGVLSEHLCLIAALQEFLKWLKRKEQQRQQQ